MSTPSTATITVPPNHQYYSHQATYLPPMNEYPHSATYSQSSARPAHQQYSNGYATGNAPSDLRRTATTSSRQPQSIPAQAYDAPSPSNTMANSRKREREQVDWEQYFGGKVPKEIIVIDDDEEDTGNNPQANQSSLTMHAARAPATANSNSRHTDKRRKMAASTTYDPVYHQQQSYSATQTPYYDEAGRNYTGSTDRGSYQTTAPTSLGSQVSNGTYLDEGTVGQKRKRVTRQVAADQKRREVEARSDPYADYVPPPKPPFKAREVYVQVIPDRTASRDQKVDDEDGHYVVQENADLTERYSIIKLLGQGTFGKVVKAWDRRRQIEVAIKVIRSVQKYRDASRIELRVLKTLKENDQTNRNKCIHFRETFDFRNHICIVTDLLGQSVFDFLKGNQFVPFPSSHIQGFARQLFTSVAFLHDLNLIHTDLKPENILLVNANYQTFTYNRNIPSSSNTTSRSAKFRKVLLDPEIRLIDFGSATFDDEYHSSVVSTRHYRAPEIILNLGWSFPCDIWSIGCILVEFFTGDALFQTHDNLEHLAMMEAVCNGPLDKHLVKQVTSSRGSNKNPAAAFFKRGVLDYPQPDTARSSRKFVKAMKKLDVRPPVLSALNNVPYAPIPTGSNSTIVDLANTEIEDTHPKLKKNPYTVYLRHLQDTIPAHTEFNRNFLDLLRRIFVYDPKKRITAKEALRHPWFKEMIEDDGTEATKIRVEREKAERMRIPAAR